MIKIGNIRGESALNGALRVFLEQTERAVLDELKITGGSLATRLAYSTQPFGDDAGAMKRGREAVARDIRKVFSTPSSLYKALEIQDPKSAILFWSAYKRDDESAMQRILGKSKFGEAQLMRVPDASLHESMRKSRGRVYIKKPRGVILQDGARAAYIRERQEAVGLSKTGWIRAARSLDSGGSVPSWITPGKHPGASGGATVRDVSGELVVTIQNTTPWIREILTERAEAGAVRIGEERLLKRIDIILRKEAQAAGIDSPF